MIKKTIKIPLFWKIYIIVVTIVLIGFVVLWSILWTALKKYEQSRPEYAMDKITETITGYRRFHKVCTHGGKRL